MRAMNVDYDNTQGVASGERNDDGPSYEMSVQAEQEEHRYYYLDGSCVSCLVLCILQY